MANYMPGDVVNGHRLNESGTQWIPLGHPAPQLTMAYPPSAPASARTAMYAAPVAPSGNHPGYGAGPPTTLGADWGPPSAAPGPVPSSRSSTATALWIVGAAALGAMMFAFGYATGRSDASVDASLVQEVEAAYDSTVAIMEGWESTFEAPDIEYLSSTIEVDGESLDPDNAYYSPYDETVYIGTEYLAEIEDMPGEAAGTVAHELGHALEGQNGTTASTAVESENYADCIEGAVGAEAGWDTQALAENNYDFGDLEVGDEQTHGTPQERYDATLDGAEYGYEYCEANYQD